MPPDPRIRNVGAAALVTHPDAIPGGPALLMLERKGSDGDGTWAIPGGWLQWDLEDPLPEDAFTAAVRECREETGVWVEPFAAGGYTIHVLKEPSPRAGEACVTLFAVCKYLAGVPQNREERRKSGASKVEWVLLDEVTDRVLYDPLAQWWATNGDYLRQAQ